MIATFRQRGSVLIISLVMLTLLTLIAVSAIQTTTGMIQVVGNAQFREEGIAAGQQVIDQLLGSITGTSGIVAQATAANAAATSCADISGDGVCDYEVTFDPLPQCLSKASADSYVDAQIVIEGNNVTAFQAVADAADDGSSEEAAALAKKEEARNRRISLGTCKATASSPTGQCYWSLWRISAEVTDSFTGTGTRVVQGARILIGINDNVNNCS